MKIPPKHVEKQNYSPKSKKNDLNEKIRKYSKKLKWRECNTVYLTRTENLNLFHLPSSTSRSSKVTTSTPWPLKASTNLEIRKISFWNVLPNNDDNKKTWDVQCEFKFQFIRSGQVIRVATLNESTVEGNIVKNKV